MVDDSQTVEQLIADNLVEGCVEVSNIETTINGSANDITSFGYFENADSNFPFQNGILLSTGRAIAAGNAVNTNVLNDGNAAWSTDSDLEDALGVTGTLNATSIEFDFTSVSNQISFNYLLASEEYVNNLPCNYSDGFAFLIREAGTNNPYTNIAVIPGTTTPVSTNTIHEDIVGFCDAENEEYFEGYNVGDTNFNGRTVVLTAQASIQPNVQYHIKLVIADQTDQFYDSAVFIEGNSFNASVNLGPDITTCSETVSLNGNIENPLATYQWYLDNAVLNGETNPTITASSSGTYRIEITIPLNDSTCVIEDEIIITLESEQQVDAVSDYELCDDVINDGIVQFDLASKETEILSSLPTANYNVTYHPTSEDAQNNTNAYNSTINNTSNPQPIFVRIEDEDSGCLAFTMFNLIVNPVPNISTPTTLLPCDDSTADGITLIDLTEKDDEITNGNSNLQVTYHYSAIDAENGTNAIPQPYTNTNQTEQVFVRVTNPETGCYNTTTLDVEVLDTPDINSESITLNACEEDGDGFANFDLTEAIDDVLQGLTGVTVTYHENFQDAQTGDNPIPDPTNYENTEANVQTVYIRVVDDSTGCFSIASITLHTNLLITGTNIRDFQRCDDSSNDGIEDFNLENIGLAIINGVEDTTIAFYETEEDQTNQTNEIDQSVPFTVSTSPTELFFTLSTTDCTYSSSINLIINPPVVLLPLDPVTYCDTDDDGFVGIELETFSAQVSNGIEAPFVSYHLTESDALNNENSLPPIYTNTTNPQIVYVRVLNTITGCSDVEPLEITVLAAPTITQATDEIICDDNQDAAYLVNLNDKISEIISSTNGLTISMHNSLDDADSNENEITNTTNYNATTETIHIRIENDVTGCYALTSYNIIINTLPVFPDISNFQGCESDGNQIADFIFNEKDDEILNGQTGKEVLYFETQQDAINRTNIIDKNAVYQNTSTPQTIYVRVENTTDQDCFGVDSFILEVGSIPIFTAPTDWFVCDDISNDGVVTFNFQEKVDEMSTNSPENLTITFHISFEDADNATNALGLEYTNTANPQQIFARIENGTYCHAVAEFGLNIVQVPEVNTASALTECDTDFDGSVVFDLTITEFEILDVRDDDIVVTYFPSLEDAEADTNQILNPESYENITNPQTVIIKVNNTISDCFVTVPVELIVNLPPSFNENVVLETCDNDTNTVNLHDVRIDLIGVQPSVNLFYYLTEEDAENDTNAINNIFTYTTNTTTIYVRAVDSISGCFATSSFVLQVNPSPSVENIGTINFCDDDYDGFLVVNLTTINADILGSQNAENFTVQYYNSLEDAENNTNAIENIETYNAETQVLYARVTNNTTSCYTTTNFNLNINRKPVVVIEDQVICLDNLPLIVSAQTDFDTDSYIWSTNETTPEIEITEVGTYSVIVTSQNGCSTATSFSVTESEQATITFTETVDFSDPNNVIVTVEGIGNYVYQLNNGEPQISNTFYNVPLGPNTITITDLNGCASATKEIVIIDTPKFMTPNNDTHFDTWHITGVSQLVGTTVTIFDRFGKQMAFLTHTSEGWDGTYNGRNMPASDYWFVANVKSSTKQFQIKGHFALKR